MENTLYLNVERCAGCGACVVACMDQNDIYPEKGQIPLRGIYQIEEGRYPEASIYYISVAGQNCNNSPGIIACPAGAISRDKKTKSIRVDRSLCTGRDNCGVDCPFGLPGCDIEVKMQDCDLCSERVDAGLQPACVRVCPFQALRFEPLNNIPK